MSTSVDQLIKKIRLRKGCRYILIIPDSAGLKPHHIAALHDKLNLDGVSVMVKSARGIKVVEQEAHGS